MVKAQDFQKFDSAKSDSPTTLPNTLADWFASWQLGFLTCYVSFGAFVFTLEDCVLLSLKTVQGEDDEVLSKIVLIASQLRLSGIALYSCQTN